MTSRPSTSSSYASISYQNGYSTSASQSIYGTTTRSSTTRPGTTRPGTRRSSRTGSVFGGGESQQIICAISEGRGITPTVGLSFVNISTGEAVLSQICDNQFYARTLNKLQVFEPTEILIVSTVAPPNPKSKMYQIVEENIYGAKMVAIDRKYWSETLGLDFIRQLAFSQDLEALKVAIGGNYFATCCFSAALKYIELKMSLTFAFHSLRIKYQPSEGTMMIDLSTIRALELIQNIHDTKSKHCLLGLMSETLTPMGSRLLRSSILQPSTQSDVLTQRYEAAEELLSHDDMFYQTRQGLKSFNDIEKLLTLLITIPMDPSIRHSEQAINHILMLKNFVEAAPKLFEVLGGARSELLVTIRENCRPGNIDPTTQLIKEVVNDDVTYQKKPLDLRNQRTYAVKAGVCGFLDVARQTFKEATEDVHQHVTEINQQHEMQAETRYDTSRYYYLRVRESDFDGRTLPDILINCFRKKSFIECQTLALVKLNQRIADSHQEVVLTSDKTIQQLLDDIRGEIPSLFKVCESIAMLDMIAAFGHLAIVNEYVKPEIGDCLMIESGRHPIKERVHKGKFVPNDVYATQQSRFQIITGCNMSGKSTYIRSIALMCVMAQIGSFVPARFARFPIIRQIFARVSMDDSIDANVSTFASEMRETAFILRNIDQHSLAIIDELGRGTSTRDGLAIALSIAEALVESKALIWFVTHFRELAQVMHHRPGVVNQHLAVDMAEPNSMTMLYKVKSDFVREDHYGLALARVMDLPAQVLEVAEKVTKTLDDRAAAKKKCSMAIALAKRRKLVLSLKETLSQAADSPMDGAVLLSWLRKLQEEFIRRMYQIDNEVSTGDSENEDDVDPGEDRMIGEEVTTAAESRSSNTSEHE
ncbi:p-loop containing nucleoside triphosphate hydrolase [Venustampulla echinocandica]|uniref:DNA mismatch repair protein MSH3 n=1 Tax=Venustampulla echinocandica TaxID=2656787 RepID=A0A370TN17_9HELO|nr:p-loop containing nucleoside triphosphate hydrolase [Venustampulla echinocandica]RDL36911.1 p-loop containing nucleoside triphosphate hydrolase [Venustampulla echinocandica]